MIYGIAIILLGVLAIPSLVMAKKPESKQFFDAMAPIQGWLGLVFAVWGIVGIIRCILNIGLISIIPIWWIFWLVTVVVTTALGLILGYALINKYVLSKNENAAAKGAQTMQKLLPLQGILGIAGVVIGVIVIILNIIY